MKKVLIGIVFLLMLTGCNATPEEQLLTCFDKNCEETEKSEVVIEYVDSLAEYDILEYMDGYTPFGTLAYNETKAVIGVIYENSQDTYSDGFDQLDKLYELFLVMESGLLDLEVNQNLEIVTMISIEEGINDYYFRFHNEKSTGRRILSVELDGFKDEHDVFMNLFYSELLNVFEYTNNDFDIKIDLVTDIGYIHLLNVQDSETIELRYNSDVSDEIYQARLNDLIENIENALNNEYSVYVSD
jgi:hypothetical protein